MEEPHCEQIVSRWSQPRRCRRCRYPMAQSLEACPSCQRPARLLSPLMLQRLGRRAAELLRKLVSIAQLIVLCLAGLTLAYYLSPLLLLFPLAAVVWKPPASRGGKTVVIARRRQ